MRHTAIMPHRPLVSLASADCSCCVFLSSGDRPLDAVSSAKQSERAERRKPKKRRTMKRCTSPSHFAVDPEEEIRYGEDYTLDLPSRERVDMLLRGVAAFYYHAKEPHPNQTAVWVDSEYDQTQYTTLDLLVSPIRRVSARESWSNREVAIFEAAMCKHPKEFGVIAALIKTKTVQQVVQFYYTSVDRWTHDARACCSGGAPGADARSCCSCLVPPSFWKHHAHYRIWKNATAAAPATDVSLSAPASTRLAAPPRASPQPKKLLAAAPAGDVRPGSTNPASAAFSAIPPSLIAARHDTAHLRIRIVDPKTGAESFFLLPTLDGPEADQPEQDDADQEEEERDEEEGDGEDEEEPPHPEEEEEEKQPDAKMRSEADVAVAPRAPTRGFRCCLPSTSPASTGQCGKFCRTTNALGSHLRMTHGLAKALSQGGHDTTNLYVECVQ